MIQQCSSIQDSSSKIMNFVVDDLLDFAQLNNEKFRKDLKEFDIHEAIEEVINIQKEKATMQELELNAKYKPQAIGQEVLSFFNESKTELCNLEDLVEIGSMTCIVKSDKRRI